MVIISAYLAINLCTQTICYEKQRSIWSRYFPSCWKEKFITGIKQYYFKNSETTAKVQKNVALNSDLLLTAFKQKATEICTIVSYNSRHIFFLQVSRDIFFHITPHLLAITESNQRYGLYKLKKRLLRAQLAFSSFTHVIGGSPFAERARA